LARVQVNECLNMQFESELLMVFMSIRILPVERLRGLTEIFALCMCKSSRNDPALSVLRVQVEFRAAVMVTIRLNMSQIARATLKRA